MKICFLANAASVHFIRWYEYFICRGHEVHLVSGNISLAEYGGGKAEAVEGLTVHYLPEIKFRNRIISFGINTLDTPRLRGRLKRRLREIQPDIIHAHQVYPFGFWGALSGFHPFVVTPIGSDVLILANQYRTYGALTRLVLRNADMVTGDSVLVGENCRKFGWRQEFHMIHNGVDMSRFVPQKLENRQLIRKRHGLAEDQPLVFYGRAFTPLYNVDQIIRAIPLVLARIPDCSFIMASHFGDMDAVYRHMIAELELEDHVHFTGLIDHKEMPMYYQAADLVLSVPRSDNSPSSVYEAMATGVPTVISRLPWTRYAMKDRENTYMIKEVTPESVAEAVVRMLTDHELRETVRALGFETVKRHFDYHENMARMEDLMLELLNGRSSA